MHKTVTFSHSLLLPLSRACGADCRYCTFKSDQVALLTFDEIENLIRRHQTSGACEAVLMAGQSLESVPGMSNQWMGHGFSGITEYIRSVCQLVIEHQMLPSLDVGPLSYAQLEVLAPHVTAITLLLENINVEFLATIQSNKRVDDKIETITDAAHFRVPVNTGLLVGAGESLDDAFATLHQIEELYQSLQNIQSVRIQCVHRPDMTESYVTPELLALLTKYSHKLMPDIPVTVSHSVAVPWWSFDGVEVDDLGPVYEGYDGIHWDAVQPKVTEIERDMGKNDWALRPRLPLFQAHFHRTGRSQMLDDVLEQWRSKREFSYYDSGDKS